MANIRDIRRRIRSAKNIQQITRAMKFVSAARLRKAQDRVIAARPYARQMLAVLNSLATRVPEQSHPLLAQREGPEDRAGGHHRRQGAVRRLQHQHPASTPSSSSPSTPTAAVELNILGKRARDFFRRRSYAVRHEAIDVLQRAELRRCRRHRPGSHRGVHDRRRRTRSGWSTTSSSRSCSSA